MTYMFRHWSPRCRPFAFGRWMGIAPFGLFGRRRFRRRLGGGLFPLLTMAFIALATSGWRRRGQPFTW